MVKMLFEKTYSQLRLRVIVILIFLFGYSQLTTRMIDVARNGGHNWAAGEWLINYQGGFVRRGLPGQIILSLPFSANFRIAILVAFLIILVTVVEVILLYIIIKSNLNFRTLLLILNPAGLLFIFWDPYVFIRKEWLGYFLIILLLLNVYKFKKFSLNILVIVFYILSVLSSEVNAAFAPLIYFLLNQNVNSRMSRPILRIDKIFIFVFVLTSSFVIYFHGTSSTSSKICGSLVNEGFDRELNCNGAIATLGYTLVEALSHFKSDFPDYFLYLILGFLAFIPIRITEWYKHSRKVALNVFLGSAPLFLIAWDYGRWISLFITQLTIYILFQSFFGVAKIVDNDESKLSMTEVTLLVCFLLWGMGHGGSPISNGWIGIFPSLINSILSTP